MEFTKRFTRKQMIGKISNITGERILEYVTHARDSKGNFLNVFRVETCEGKTEEKFVHPHDQTQEFYIDEGEESERIRSVQREFLRKFREQERRESEFFVRVARASQRILPREIAGDGVPGDWGSFHPFRGPWMWIPIEKVPNLEVFREILGDFATVVHDPSSLLHPDDLIITPKSRT